MLLLTSSALERRRAGGWLTGETEASVLLAHRLTAWARLGARRAFVTLPRVVRDADAVTIAREH